MASKPGLTAIAAAIIIAGQASAQTVSAPPPETVIEMERGARSGERQELGYRVFVNSDCAPGGEVRGTVTEPPRHGRIEILPGLGYPNFPTTNVRHACNATRYPATISHYTSDPGFVGDDHAEILATNPNGSVERYRLIIHVY